MSVTVEPFEPGRAQEWDRFVETDARNGTFLHSRRFFMHNPANELDDASLMFRERGRLVGVFPAALLDAEDGGRVYNSHPRATYGGFVISRTAGIGDVLEMVDLAIDHGRALGASRMVVRGPFRILHTAPSDEADYAMWLRGFSVAARELEVAVPLEGGGPDEALARFDSKTRNQVRKALRCGVTVRESGDFAPYWEVLTDNLRERHATRPTHSLDEILRLRELVGRESVRLFVAEHEERLVAGMVAFQVNPRVLHAQYIASRSDARHLCPVNAVIHHAVTWAGERGFRYLNLGMSTEDSGRRPNLGLFAFKEGFGGRSVLRETMALSLRP